MMKSVQTSICLKRKKKFMLPFYFSSHSVHLSNKVSTEKRKLAKFNLLYSTLLSDLQRDLNNSIELNKITLLSSFHSLDTNDPFNLLHKLSGSTPIPSVVKLGASCASTDNTEADLFNNFFCSVYKSETFTYNGCSDNTSINLRELSVGESDVNSLLKKVPDTTAVAADGIPHLFSNIMLMHSRLWFILYSVKLLPAVFGSVFGKRRLSCLFISPGQNLTLQIIVELVFYRAYRFAWKNCFLISFILMFDTNFPV